jgi:hypothetical protein
MGRSRRFVRARAWWLAAASAACAVAASVVACITPLPPPIPTLATCKPSILTESVVPVDEILMEWPADNRFIVPVTYQSCDPTDGFDYAMFIDFTPTPVPSAPVYGPAHLFFASDGGATIVDIAVAQPQDGNTCHVIEIKVAHVLNPPHVPDSLGGASVHWYYSATGSINGCPQYDAGDGAFPIDSPSDTLPFVPDGGSG